METTIREEYPEAPSAIRIGVLLKWSFHQSDIDTFFLLEENDLKMNQLNRNKTDFQQSKQGLETEYFVCNSPETRNKR